MKKGRGKSGEADFRRYLQIVMGSANELECLLLFSHDLNYFGEEVCGELSNNLVEIRKMPNALLQRPKANR